MNQRKLFGIAWLLVTFLLVGSLFASVSVVYAFGPDTDLSNADASFWGEDAGDESGFSVATAGDVNGDGLGDFLIGAWRDEDGGTGAGQTYLMLGRAVADWGMDFDLSNADASFWGEDAGDKSGGSVATAGDVNGDGLDDFLIGAMWDEDGGTNAGQTYLILGRAAADWGMDFDLSNADASFWGEDAGDFSGYPVASAGDVNGDGLDDFLIGAHGDDDGGDHAGQTYLILGRAAADWGMDFDLSNADASFWGEDAGDYSGYSLASAEDVNGDGLDDFLIGAYGDEDGGTDAGQTYLILGRAAADWGMDFDLSNADASFWGEDAGDHSGFSAASAGDVNSDGRDDFLIGAFGDEDGGGTFAGQTYLILGRAAADWAMDFDLSNADASFWGEDIGDYSGFSVASAGDVNGDGRDDFLIGAYGDDDGGSWAGQTYLWLGTLQYDLTISSTTGGNVTAPGETTFTYNEGTLVELVAEADIGYHFVNWTGDVGTIANVNAPRTAITMNGNYSITANFASGYTPMVAAGWHHIVGLRADGAVVAAGYNELRQCEVTGWADIVQVAAGAVHTVGLKSDGTVVAVGWEIFGQCNVGSWTNITRVAAGTGHTVGLKSDGTVVAAGDNSSGQCNVGGWNGIIQVAAGSNHTLGLNLDGTVVAMGSNTYGQCNVGGWANITQVSAGDAHAVGLMSNGTVIAVGWNQYGQCNVTGWTNITQVAAGWGHTVGLRSNGTVVAVGANFSGECNVGSWTSITQIAARSSLTVGLMTNGTVLHAGIIDPGQCNVGGWTGINQTAAGAYHTVGGKADGTVVAVGGNYWEQLNVGGWASIIQIAAAWGYTVGLKADGTVVAAGLLYGSEASNVTSWTNITQVATFAGLMAGLKSDGTIVLSTGSSYSGTGIIQIDVGLGHLVVLKSDGTVVAGGNNSFGQCNVLGWRNITQISAGRLHTVGLKNDGTVIALGRSLEGQCNVGGWTGINQVAAGAWHTVGLKSDGTVVAVGENYHGQCNVSGWTDIIQVAASYTHTVGLKSDGTVVAVGAETEPPSWNLYETPTRRFTLTIFSTAGGNVTEPGDGTFTYDEGTMRNLVAEPQEGYRFVCWTGDVGTIANVYAAATTITMNNNYSITATFTAVVNSKTETITGGGTVNATGEADTEVEVTGNATVTVAQYADNPGGYSPSGFNSLDKYIDVYIPYAGEVSEVEIRLYYTPDEVPADIDENSLKLFWWNGAVWQTCDPSGVNTTATPHYVWAQVRTTGTTPTLAELEGTPFAPYGSPSSPPPAAPAPTPSPPPWGYCFIATAAYGTPMAEEIQILREFRDEYLLTNPLGRAFVDLYYRVSPPIAEFITEHPILKPIVRAGLVPVVAMSTVAVNTTPAEKAIIIGLLTLISAALAAWATRRRGGDSEYT